MNLPTEVKLAQRIRAKHALSTPFNLKELAELYAEVIYTDIPIEGVDGVSVNLKVIGKRPRIIVNTRLPHTRQLFTLAHELGHIIIPWHIGTIVDDLYNSNYKDLFYSILEQEANLFAAELLMPRDWIFSNYEDLKPNIAALHQIVVDTIGVSDHAAAISLIKVLPPGIIYVAEEKNIILHSGKTGSTMAKPPETNQQFKKDLFPYINAHTKYKSRNITFHWFDLNAKVKITATDTREWRQILHEIAADIKPTGEIPKFKMSVNGVVSSQHGSIKLSKKNYNYDTVLTACLYRFERGGFEDLVSHPDFKIFLKVRIEDFFK